MQTLVSFIEQTVGPAITRVYCNEAFIIHTESVGINRIMRAPAQIIVLSTHA